MLVGLINIILLLGLVAYILYVIEELFNKFK